MSLYAGADDPENLECDKKIDFSAIDEMSESELMGLANACSAIADLAYHLSSAKRYRAEEMTGMESIMKERCDEAYERLPEKFKWRS